MTKNSEERIRNCLNSIFGLVDEIIVIDSHSTDKTVQICEEYGAKVFQYDFCGFGALKKIAAERASGEWILTIDCDEVISTELRNEIIKRLKADEDVVCYYAPRKNFVLKKHLKMLDSYCCKLIKKNAFALGREYVHEEVHASPKVKGEIKQLKSSLLHYSYDSWSQYLKKFDLYTSLEALELHKNQENLGFAKSLLKSMAIFCYYYIIRRGMLDGYVGFIFSFFSAVYPIVVYAKYRKLKDLKKEG